MLYRHTEPPGTIIGTHSWSGRPSAHTDRRGAGIDIFEAVEAGQMHEVVRLDDRSERVVAVVDVKRGPVLLAGVFHAEVALVQPDLARAEQPFGGADQIGMDGDVVETGVVPGKQPLPRREIVAPGRHVVLVRRSEQ